MNKHLFEILYKDLHTGDDEVAYAITPTKFPYRHRNLLRRKGYARQKMTHLGEVPYEAQLPATAEQAQQLLKEA